MRAPQSELYGSFTVGLVKEKLAARLGASVRTRHMSD